MSKIAATFERGKPLSVRCPVCRAAVRKPCRVVGTLNTCAPHESRIWLVTGGVLPKPEVKPRPAGNNPFTSSRGW